jgi:hypothetical protein
MPLAKFVPYSASMIFVLLFAGLVAVWATRGFVAGIQHEQHGAITLTDWVVSAFVGVLVAAVVIALFRGI